MLSVLTDLFSVLSASWAGSTKALRGNLLRLRKWDFSHVGSYCCPASAVVFFVRNRVVFSELLNY